MKKLISLAGLLAVAVIAGCRPQTGPSAGSPGGADARAALDGFMAAVNAQDLQGMTNFWGSKDGSVRETNAIPRAEMEQRELIMICYLKHDSFRVLTEAPGQNDDRVLAVEVVNGGLTRTTNFQTVLGPHNRWYVRNVDLEPLTEFCRRR